MAIDFAGGLSGAARSDFTFKKKQYQRAHMQGSPATARIAIPENSMIDATMRHERNATEFAEAIAGATQVKLSSCS